MADVQVMEVDPHNEIVELTPEQKEKTAESKRLKGNEFYKSKDYTEAIKFYTEAIDLCPNNAPFYGNRSAALIMLEKFDAALEDARQALQLDSAFIKAYLREAKCHIALGNTHSAVRSYNKALETDPDNATAKSELKQAQNLVQLEDRGEEEYKKGDYRTALFCLERCSQNSPHSNKFKIRKAELLVYLSRYQDAQEIVNDIMRSDPRNADAIFVRGLCLYYEDHIDKAFQHFQSVLRLAPDHTLARQTYKKAKALIAKKEEGNKAFRGGKLEDAYTLYSEALSIDPNNKFTNSKLYNNRATVLSKQKKLEEAIADCTKAVELDESYIKAYLRRAKCYTDSEQYEEAVRDYEKVFKMDKTREHQKLLQEAKLELKKSKRKDYYKILGCSKSASDDEIKKAYRKRALAHHPDRHSHDTEEKQKEEEKIFKEISEAYSVLSDPKKKARFDRGEDLDDPSSGFGDDFDPNSIFQAFFGGGQAFHMGGMGGGMGGGRGGMGSGFGGPGQGFSFHFG